MKKRDTKECGIIYENDFSKEHIHMEFYPEFKNINIFIHNQIGTKKSNYFTIDLTDEASEKLAKDIEKSITGGKDES